MKPIIGITANYMYDGSSEYAEGIGAPNQEWQLLADDYITSVMRAGGIPVILPLLKADTDWNTVKRLIDGVDGVLFSGGSDVDPMYFGQVTTGKTGNLIPERDAQERFMVQYTLEQTNKPIFGVCRGIQLINAVLGGTLIQHIPDAGFHPHTLPMYPRQIPSHWVEIEPDSLLFQVVQTMRLGVNSFHHMAVDQCAPALKVTARSDDGVIEAVELRQNPDHRFFLAVQWHPEMMSAADSVQQRLLTAFVDRCQKHG
jgi:putative glutamine amidotransferase